MFKSLTLIQLRFLYGLFLLLIFTNLYNASHFIRQQDISFTSDVARDMYLVVELKEKTLVFLDYLRYIYKINGYAFIKKPITYLVLEPNAPDNPFTSHDKFKIHQIHISKIPVEKHTFPNGYLVEKYVLTSDEIEIGFDEGVNPGLHYR